MLFEFLAWKTGTWRGGKLQRKSTELKGQKKHAQALNKDTEKEKEKILVQTQKGGQTQPNVMAARLVGEGSSWEEKVQYLIKRNIFCLSLQHELK